MLMGHVGALTRSPTSGPAAHNDGGGSGSSSSTGSSALAGVIARMGQPHKQATLQHLMVRVRGGG